MCAETYGRLRAFVRGFAVTLPVIARMSVVSRVLAYWGAVYRPHVPVSLADVAGDKGQLRIRP